jgi:hypothetical protein
LRCCGVKNGTSLAFSAAASEAWISSSSNRAGDHGGVESEDQSPERGNAGSAHAVHIHLGSCDSQGAVKYPLNDLVASPAGTAEATTVIQNVDQAPPASGWYINVHLGSSSQIEQNGQPTLYFQPIICGNIGK